jgi:hypothetical protein
VKKTASKKKKVVAKKSKRSAKRTSEKERRLPVDSTTKTRKAVSSGKESGPSGSTELSQRSLEAATGGESIEKVREILFGSQVRHIEKRFSVLEDRLRKEVGALTAEISKRFDSLETYVKKEVVSLGEQFKTEQNLRAKSVKELSRRVDNTDKDLADLEDKSTTAQRELRQQILEQSKTLRNESRKQHKELSAALDKATEQLRTDKTNRSDLAALLVDMAMSLNQGTGAALDIKKKQGAKRG